jgi:DASH complex subunit ASK1
LPSTHPPPLHPTKSIPLTLAIPLPEIDHNFSRAHRIVTTSILPVVENYATHSAAVWSGSQFWKSFFEASANVSLSSYEEPPPSPTSYSEAEPTTTETDRSAIETPSSTYPSPNQHSTSITPSRNADEREQEDDEDETPLSTPKAKAPPTSKAPTFSSPYESLKLTLADPSPSTLPSTPRAQIASPSPTRPAARTPANDILLHRILDKNWRLQATPHTQPRLPPPGTARKETTPGRSRRNGATTATAEEELDSSPFVEAPELHAEIFESPLRRVPGVSVLTPARGQGKGKERGVWDSDSEEEEMGGMSPPKTMQFHVPRERLLRTPGRWLLCYSLLFPTHWFRRRRGRKGFRIGRDAC